MKTKAYAKVNLGLDIIGKKENGYHLLEMIMAPITLYDEIIIEKIESGINIECDTTALPSKNLITIPTDHRNIVYKVLEKVINKYELNCGFNVKIIKNIPMEAGLGGGSSDGVATLKAVNKICKLSISNDEMIEIVKDIGSDMPFFVEQKLALVEGIGEKVKVFDSALNFHLLLVKPELGVNTKKAYSMINIDQLLKVDIIKLQNALKKADYLETIYCMGNVMEPIGKILNREIINIQKDLLDLGFDLAMMTGSGSCVLGITQNDVVFNNGYEKLKDKYFFVKKTGLLCEKH